MAAQQARQSAPGSSDQLLLQLASQHNGIQPLLRTFFGFLFRYTDVYVVDRSPQRTMGFDLGVAENLVIDCFRSFPLKTPDGREVAHPSSKQVSPSLSSPVKTSSQQSGDRRSIDSKEYSTNSSKPKTITANANVSAKSEASVSAPPESVTGSIEVSSQQQKSPSVNQVRYTTENKQVPVGNGGVGSNYVWTQTLHDATINIPFSSSTRGKDLDVQIETDYVAVGKKDSEPTVRGKPGGKVSKQNSFWTIENGTVVVELEKLERTWWRCAIEGHPEIDTTQVDSSCNITEYNDETQAAIAKIMREQRNQG